ncbi:MAG: magnesium chelatase [Methylibium sp. NZG]|nr:MAG: magnesium chelatase [Methylibium sp. NZG]
MAEAGRRIARDDAEAAWADALHAATLFAVDPVGIGGVALRSPAGLQRERWLAWLRGVLPADAPVRRVPLHIHDARLLGGLDLAATLRAGRPVAERGLIAEADGGVLMLAMAERLSAGTAARLAAVLDTQEVVMERDGLALRQPARVGVVALDEGVADDEQLPAALRDRCAFMLPLEPLPSSAGKRSAGGLTASADELDASPADVRDDVAAARARLPHVSVSDELVQALCAAALALGVHSARAPLHALRVARAAAALAGRGEVSERDAALAARLVLAPRATQMPTLAADAAEPEPGLADGDDAPPPQDSAAPPPPAEPAPQPQSASAEPEGDAATDDAPAEDEPPPLDPGTLDDLILDAARAAIPAGLLAALKLGQGGASRSASAGRAGQVRLNRLRGRPSGVRRGEPRAGARLNVIETLRAAAPWQAVRGRELEARGEQGGRDDASSGTGAAPRNGEPDRARRGTGQARPPGAGRAATAPPHPARIQVRREDFHVNRYKQHGETTTVFIVDASGSAALHRLAEAKGAVELLLADCYVRRDRVAVLAFRGKTAELLLPPTRSLVRAKRSLAGLPGGGGTPLAAGIDAALALADAIQRRGETPILVLLTDGRGNIARDGTPGRQRAGEDALAAARQVRLAGVTALLLDTSPQPQPAAEQLATAMGAGYLPLPYAGAAALSSAVRLATVNRA